MAPKKKIGFYGGTFDPPHLGHLNMAVAVLEQGLVDEIYVCPTSSSKFKSEHVIIGSPEERLEMVQLQFGSLEGIVISEHEIFQEGPVYTVDTLRELQREDISWHLILGEDVAFTVEDWKGSKTLIEEFPWIVCPRLLNRKGLSARVSKELLYKVETSLICSKIFEISSTDVRSRLCKGKFCEHLLHRKVLDFLKQKEIYFKP